MYVSGASMLLSFLVQQLRMFLNLFDVFVNHDVIITSD